MANPEEVKPRTEAGIAFVKWIGERRKLTDEEIADIEAEILGLKEGIAPLDLKPKTEYGIAFAQWALDFGVLTKEDLLEIETQLQGLKPVKPPVTLPPPPPKPPVPPPLTPPKPTGPPPLTQYEWQMKKKAEEGAEEKKKAAAKAKAEAAAKAKEEAIKPPTPPKQPTVKPDLIIKRTKYPKWWDDEGMAPIALTSPGSQFVITARGDFQLYISTIVLTVSGECNVTFAFGSAGRSGPMDFGGADEPRGIVIAMGNSPAPCGTGSFMVTATSSEPVQIGGFVSYFLWKKEAA